MYLEEAVYPYVIEGSAVHSCCVLTLVSTCTLYAGDDRPTETHATWIETRDVTDDRAGPRAEPPQVRSTSTVWYQHTAVSHTYERARPSTPFIHEVQVTAGGAATLGDRVRALHMAAT